MAQKNDSWLDLIPKLPGWITGLIAFVSAIVGFIKLWQGDTDLVTIVLLVVGVGGIWLGCAYLAFKRTQSSVQGGALIWQHPHWRPWALAGLVIIPIVTLVGGIALARYQDWQATRSMTPIPEGKLGVVVANFGEGPDFKESPKGKDVSEAIYRSLSERLRQAGMSQIIIRQLKTTIHNEKEAKELGSKLGTTIVIWGRIGIDKQVLFPNFTLLKVLEVVSVLEPTDLSPYYTPMSSSQTVQLGEGLSGRASILTAFVMGLIHMSNQDYKEASREFDRAIGLAEENTAADILYDYRGRAYIGQWELGLALEDFRHALSLNPNNPSLYVGIGSIYYHQQDWEQASEMYQRALDIQPGYARAYQGLGAISSIQGNYHEAIRYFELAVASKEDYALAYYSLGVTNYRLGNRQASVNALENCLKFAGTNEGLKSAAEQNLALARQMPATTAAPSPSPTRTPTPTPSTTPTHVATATSTPTYQAMTITAMPTNTLTPILPAFTPMPPPPISTPALPATPTPYPYPAPEPMEPPQEMTIIGRLIRFEWTWRGVLGPDEYFDLKIRPPGDPNSVFVDWSKEPWYILNADIALLEEGKTYVWTTQVIKGHFEGERKVLDAYLSPESTEFVTHRGVEIPEPASPSDEGTGGLDELPD